MEFEKFKFLFLNFGIFLLASCNSPYRYQMKLNSLKCIQDRVVEAKILDTISKIYASDFKKTKWKISSIQCNILPYRDKMVNAFAPTVKDEYIKISVKLDSNNNIIYLSKSIPGFH